MAKKQVLTWKCDCCGSTQDGDNMKTMPPGWTALSIRTGKSTILAYDSCPVCTAAVEKALINRSKKKEVSRG